jgi:hypothetical protein
MRGAGTLSTRGRLAGIGGDWEIRQEPTGALSFDLGASPFTGNEPFSTLDPVNINGRWYHIVATYSDVDNSYQVYIDGKLRTSGISPVDLIPQAAGPLTFGIRAGTAEYWNGGLRDFRVYNRRINPAEIAQLYGMVGYWKLDEASGVAAADSSGSGANGTVNGTPTWSYGRIQNGLKFDGNTSVGITGLFGKPRNVTIAAWAKLTAADTNGAEVISLGDSFAIRLDDSGTAKAFFYNGTSWTGVPFTQMYAGSGWHHFAAVFDDDHDYCKLYVDGVEKANLATVGSIAYTLNQDTTIGRHGNGSTTFDFTGTIDDVRVYARALCPADIMQLYGSAGPQGIRIIKWFEVQ